MKQWLKNQNALVVGLGVGLLLALITWLAYAGGEASGTFEHCYYIPIIIASYGLGDVGAVVTSLGAALLAAVVPVDVAEAAPQRAQEITTRTALFFFIGLMTAQLFHKLQERRADADSLLRLSRSVNASLRPTEVLRTIAETAVRLTSAKACSIRLLNREGTELIPAASYGLSLDYLAKGPLRIAENPIDQLVAQGRVVPVLEMSRDARVRYPEEAKREGLVSLLSIPLQKGATIFGVLRVYSAARHQWSPRESRLLQGYAELAGIAIHNARLHEDLRKSYWETVNALARAIEAKDPHTLGHSERVTDYALQLGRACGLSPEEMETLRFAATLHDIGKLGVGDEMGRAGHPDFGDELVIRMHPLIGISILQPVEFLGPALGAVRSHHERWDGNGYPEGLAGEQIPFLARLLAVVNTYDRLRMETPGRSGLSAAEALQELRGLAGTALDPRLAELFAKTFDAT